MQRFAQKNYNEGHLPPSIGFMVKKTKNNRFLILFYTFCAISCDSYMQNIAEICQMIDGKILLCYKRITRYTNVCTRKRTGDAQAWTT